MKIILPSLAIVAVAVRLAFAQSGLPQGGTTPIAAVGSTTSTTDQEFRLPEASPAPLSSGVPVEGADLLIQRGAVADAASVGGAQIHYQVNLFGHQILGKGVYLQHGFAGQRKVRLELTTVVGKQLLSYVYVCDGNYLFQYQPPLDRPRQATAIRPTVTRVDLHRVQRAMEKENRHVESDLAAMVGGLPKLLDGLQRSFRFTRADAGNLEALPVWIASGSWRPEALAGISKELANQAQRGQPLNLSKLPVQLPEEVRVYFGQDDYFPYRIEFLRRIEQSRGGEGSAIATATPILIIEFVYVQLNAPIDSQQFVYQPEGNAVVDGTQNFMKMLGLKQE